MALTFRYNSKTFDIECSNPNIRIEVIGRSLETPFRMVLFHGPRRIGIELESKYAVDAEDRNYLSEWIVTNLHCMVWRDKYGQKPPDYCPSGKFRSLPDQDRCLEIVTGALKACNFVDVPPRIEPKVTISPALQRRLNNQELIEKVAS